MKSRYSAYAVGESSYLVKTTHEDNEQYMDDVKAWRQSIEAFTKETQFLGLEILAFIEGEKESFVTFKALLSSGEMIEKSRFLKVDKRWLYERGEIF